MSLTTLGLGTDTLITWGLGGVEIEIEAVVERPRHLRRRGGLTGWRRRSKVEEREIIVRVRFLDENKETNQEVVISNLKNRDLFAEVSNIYVSILGNLIPLNEANEFKKDVVKNPISAVVKSITKVLYENNDSEDEEKE